MRDLLVAGGGPVGLATALYAARAGLDVGVVEPREGVIDKACGEGLMPGAVAALTDLGVPLDGHPITGIRYVDGEHVAEARFRHGAGRGVRRTTLHRALGDAVLAAGVKTDPRAVREVVDRGDHLLVDGEPTRYLVAADGLHSPVRRMTGLDAPTTTARRYGQRCHVDVAPWTSFVEVHWAASSEAYVTPVGPDRVGVAVLTSQRRSFADLITDFPVLVERLRGAPAPDVRGAGPLRQQSRRRAAGRVLLVGDAAGYVDALTGEGIALGVAQARAAVRAVVAGDPVRYDRDSRRLSRRHELLTRGLLAATRHPGVRRRVVPAAAALPWVFGTAVDQLARPA
ncbi:NAD(P)/FAD-dependent oxidoreductase [Nocardioides lijunqiniae]|uniref:NAD(P)/FAD-dependent oxidoreductase n=1 Tax=Nocardioides lijunqiniae TaxID=2760832 RepID=UPI001877E934|nr:NAD(P)/FAD-dependent oxidoreductase [Nocardioides lijunqiniae]